MTVAAYEGEHTRTRAIRASSRVCHSDWVFGGLRRLKFRSLYHVLVLFVLDLFYAADARIVAQHVPGNREHWFIGSCLSGMNALGVQASEGTLC